MGNGAYSRIKRRLSRFGQTSQVPDNTSLVGKKTALLATPLITIICGFSLAIYVTLRMTAEVWSHAVNANIAMQSSLSALVLMHNLYAAVMVRALVCGCVASLHVSDA